jgi:hypothetical protein
MKWTCLSLRLTIGFLMLLLTSSPFSDPVDTGAVVQTTLIPAAQQPYPGPDPHPIPGKIEAEDYDVGGEGVAYHDTTLGNEGGEYRSDDVDVQSTTDGGDGHNVGWIEAGEWLEYTVDVASTGLYDIQVRVASAMDRRPSGRPIRFRPHLRSTPGPA